MFYIKRFQNCENTEFCLCACCPRNHCYKNQMNRTNLNVMVEIDL